MPDRPPTDAHEDSRRLRRSFLIAVCFTAALWAIKLAELALGLDLSRYSIYPGDPATLTGILFALLFHEVAPSPVRKHRAHACARHGPALRLSEGGPDRATHRLSAHRFGWNGETC
jgi:hypothetical protein